MPEVSIYAGFSAGAPIQTWANVPDVTTANKIKALAGHDKTAYLFQTLQPHDLDTACACYVCSHTTKTRDPFKRLGWEQRDPIRPYVRFDIGARNVRLKIRGGESFTVVSESDVDNWLAELPFTSLELWGSPRLGMMFALPLILERAKSKREVSAA